MNAKTLRASCAIVIAALTLDVMAQGKPIAYPSKGQSAQKQQQVDGACYSWAKSNTGIDPATASTATRARPTTAPCSPARTGIR